MEPNNKQTAVSEVAASAKEHSRRRLIKGGALGATVIMATLASRPAFAHSCKTPSAFGSMNASRPAPLIECGQSPGYWKNHREHWPGGLKPNTSFNTVFPAGLQSPPSYTLLDALSEGGGGIVMLRRKVVCALLNYLAGLAPNFLTAAEIKAMWAAASLGHNYVNTIRGIDWTAAQVISFFDSLYN